MPSSASLVYFDACIFIELLQQSNPERFEACESIRHRAEKGRSGEPNAVVIVTSSVTIVEVNRLPDARGTGISDDQSAKILAFFQNPYIAIRPLDRRTAEFAHGLVHKHGLTNLDAIHVATACVSRAPVFYT